MIILWDLSSISEVKEYFVLTYSTRFYISLILNAFLQWNSLIFSHGLLHLSSEMHHPFILYHGAIPNHVYLSRSISNVMYFMTPFTIHFSLLDFFSALISPMNTTFCFSFIQIHWAPFTCCALYYVIETQRWMIQDLCPQRCCN